MIKGTTVKEIIKMLKEYPMDSEVKIAMIVDNRKFTKDDSCGDTEGIYFVYGVPIGVESTVDDDAPAILAEDDNYDGICEKEFLE